MALACSTHPELLNAHDVEQLEAAYLLRRIELHKLHERVSSLEERNLNT